MEKILRAALYVRVSSEEQVKEGESIQAQEDALTRFAHEHNMKIQGIYRDEGNSATLPMKKRKVLMRLLDQVALDLIDVILVIKLDRWFRSPREYYKAQDILEKHNCTWRTILENDYDSGTVNGRMLINIVLAFAESEAGRGSERQKFIQAEKVRRGEPISGSQPFGYKIDLVNGRKRVVKDPELELAVKGMFDEYFRTRSITAVAHHMRDKFGMYAHRNTWSNRLYNKLYTGVYRNNVNYCEPYISLAQHNDIIEWRKTHTIKYAHVGHDMMFRGLLYCPCCGKPLHSNWAKARRNRNAYGYYRCSTYWNKRGCTFNHSLSDHRVEKQMLGAIRPAIRGAIIELKATLDRPKIQQDVAPLKGKLTKLNNMYLQDNISYEDYAAMTAQVREQIYLIEQQNADIDSDATSQRLDKLQQLNGSSFETVYETLDFEARSLFWHSIVKKIIPDGTSVGRIEF